MAQNIVYQWEQRPDYVMACRTVIPPGGPTAYSKLPTLHVLPADTDTIQIRLVVVV